MRFLLLCASLVFLLTACDCYQVVEGTVVEANTGKPLAHIHVHKAGRLGVRTDAQGHFRLSDVSGGMFGCPPMRVVIEAAAYQRVEAVIPAGGSQVVRLTPAL